MIVPGFAAGEVVDGRYRIEATLGGGGMGAVFRALDLGRGVPVALKVLGGDLDAEAAQRFEREATLSARIDREPGLVRVFSAGRHRGRPFLVMELVEGEDHGLHLTYQGRLEEALVVVRAARDVVVNEVRVRAVGLEATVLLGLDRLEEAAAAVAPLLPEGLAEEELACPAIEVAARRGERDLALERLREAHARGAQADVLAALARRLGLDAAR